MNLELHILQSYAPSNLNRDDTGSPKDCQFGGVRRARISSQCLKRSVRTRFQQNGLITEGRLGVRSRSLGGEVARLLVGLGLSEVEASKASSVAFQILEAGLDEQGDSKVLIFLSRPGLDSFARACVKNREELLRLEIEMKNEIEMKKKGKNKPKESVTEEDDDESKKAPGWVKAAPKKLKDELDVIFKGSAVDLALFGRMVAKQPKNRDSRGVVAATQVAHALSTHKVDLEFDFYTAVDDLRPEGETGAAMMGTVEYNAACFYRYANIDLGQLRDNLGTAALAREAVEAFLTASIEAVPSGKQNSMAAQNPPSLVLVVLRKSGLWSLANAFLKPVRAAVGGDLMTASMAALGDYWGKLTAMYGAPDGAWLGVATLHPDSLGDLAREGEVKTVPALVRAAVEHCSGSFGV
ncbi:MAG: type I-E CRISPR-associated protein Cas7/Cse4/CasC [Acidobacteriia bacterium]|nr:type I-E CRISPR-associated protein Cas7/Cse4/CasC [Terriglobia bacterium]